MSDMLYNSVCVSHCSPRWSSGILGSGVESKDVWRLQDGTRRHKSQVWIEDEQVTLIPSELSAGGDEGWSGKPVVRRQIRLDNN